MLRKFLFPVLALLYALSTPSFATECPQQGNQETPLKIEESADLIIKARVLESKKSPEFEALDEKGHLTQEEILEHWSQSYDILTIEVLHIYKGSLEQKNITAYYDSLHYFPFYKSDKPVLFRIYARNDEFFVHSALSPDHPCTSRVNPEDLKIIENIPLDWQ